MSLSSVVRILDIVLVWGLVKTATNQNGYRSKVNI